MQIARETEANYDGLGLWQFITQLENARPRSISCLHSFATISSLALAAVAFSLRSARQLRRGKQTLVLHDSSNRHVPSSVRNRKKNSEITSIIVRVTPCPSFELAIPLFFRGLTCAFAPPPNLSSWQCTIFDNNRDAPIRKLCNKGYFPPYTIDAFLCGPFLRPLRYIQNFLVAHWLYL